MSAIQKRGLTGVGVLVLLAGCFFLGAWELRTAYAEEDPDFAELETIDASSQTASDAELEALLAEDGVEPSSGAGAASAPPREPAAEPANSDLELDDLALELTEDKRVSPAPTRNLDEDPSVPNQVTNLEFKHDPKGSKVVVSSLKPLRFSETKSPGTKQYVYLFENTKTPERFQRAYDTTEFTSPVALFTLFQIPNTEVPTSKLIVQLREDVAPSVVETDRGLVLELPPGKAADPQVVDPGKRDIFSSDSIYAKGGGTYTGEVIQRLEIKNTDIQDVLRLIARTSGYNIVIGEDVQGKVGTLSLTNIPWDQAFTLVLQSKKLGFVREGNVLRIGTTASLRTEKEEAAAVESAQQKVESLKTVLLPISYAKAAELAPRAKTFLTDRGAIEVDIRTNTIIIKDIESVVTRVQRLLQSLDTQPPRVSISARIVEMRSSVTRNIGMNSFSGNGNFRGTNTIRGDLSTGVGGAFAASIAAPDFLNMNAAFQLGELDNRVKLLANPSVSVVANQTGTVTQSVSFFVPTTTVVAGLLQPGFTQVTTTLNLAVTPIVSGDGSIFMNVDINNDIPSISAGDSTIASRAVQTQVLVENGDTAVIGGIFQNSVNTDRSGIPFLMDIPLLGYLFSGTTTQDNRTEIFIFLTAKIMNAEESFKRTL